MGTYKHIDIKPMAMNVGAEISGVDLREPNPDAVMEIKQALIERKVLVFRDQDLTSHQYKICLLYTSPSPRDRTRSRMPSSA